MNKTSSNTRVTRGGSNQGRDNALARGGASRMDGHNHHGLSPVSGGTGRGRGDGRKVEGEDTFHAPQTQEDRMQRRDAYTVIAPNMEKKAAIERQAQRGTEMYERHKAENRTQRVSYVGTVGGGGRKERPVAQHTTPQRRAQIARDKSRQEEDIKLQQMKSKARLKSEENSAREKDRKRGLDCDRRAKNSDFLDRIERENKQRQGEKLLATAAARQLNIASDDTYVEPSEEGESLTAPVYSRRSNELDELCTEFPHYDRGVLESMLLDMGGDIDLLRAALLSD